MKTFSRLQKSKKTWFLICILFFFFLLRMPSLFEPYWYGDEGVYQTIGIAIKHDKLLYRDIWDNKPPLIYLLYSAVNSDQFSTKSLSLIFGALSIITFYFLTKNLFFKRKDFKFHLLATSLFAILFGLPIIEGNIANAENFMILPILISAIIVFKTDISAKKKTKKDIKLLLAGLLLGIAFLFKTVAIFDLSAFGAFLVIVHNAGGKNKIINALKKTVYLFAGFALPITIAYLFFLMQGSSSDFLNAVFLQNLDYISYGNTFIIHNGLTLIKLFIVILAIACVFKFRKKLSSSAAFVIIWFAFSMLNVFISERSYTHYLLVLLPSFSLLAALVFWNKKHAKFTGLIFALSLILIFNSFRVYSKSLSYYSNFLNFITNNKTLGSYYSFFDERTAADYSIALFLKSKLTENDSLFIWGDNPQVYKLTKTFPLSKYITAYHALLSKDGKEDIAETINAKKPRFIVVMPNQQNTIPFSLSGYLPAVSIDDIFIYEKAL